MTVKELRQSLEGFADDTLVVIAKDSEGNGFSPLAGPSAAIYVAETTWSGQVYDQGHRNAKDGLPCVVLDPVN